MLWDALEEQQWALAQPGRFQEEAAVQIIPPLLAWEWQLGGLSTVLCGSRKH